MYTPVGSIALDMPFHDAIMLYFCLAVSGSRGSGGPGLGGSCNASLCLPPRSSPDVAELANLPRSQPIRTEQQPTPGRLLSRGREPLFRDDDVYCNCDGFIATTAAADAVACTCTCTSRCTATAAGCTLSTRRRCGEFRPAASSVIGTLPGLYARIRCRPAIVSRALFPVDDRLQGSESRTCIKPPWSQLYQCI